MLGYKAVARVYLSGLQLQVMDYTAKLILKLHAAVNDNVSMPQRWLEIIPRAKVDKGSK